MPEPYELANTNCITHSEAIARIEANTESIKDHLGRLNGTVAKHEARVAALEAEMATQKAKSEARDLERARYESFKARTCDDIEEIQRELSEKRGGARGAIGTIREIVSILGVVLMIWMAWSAHEQSLAAQMALRQAAQQQQK